MLNVMVVGAYGNFGRLIVERLSFRGDIRLFVAGRNADKTQALAKAFECRSVVVDACGEHFSDCLKTHAIELVIHTAGPFQGQDLSVAMACIEAGSHYCDLSDCRQFVTAIKELDTLAFDAGVGILSGCSSVPTLSGAVLDHYAGYFSKIHSIDYGITSSSKMPGVATVKGVFTYAGEKIPSFQEGQVKSVIGWKGLILKNLKHGVGRRLVADIDVPDMGVFPSRYKADTVRFRAGGALKTGMIFNALAATLVQFGLIRSATGFAKPLHWLGKTFEFLGDGKSAMYIDVLGLNHEGKSLKASWQITAFEDRGPTIPACGAVALASKMAAGWRPLQGARACVGEVTMDEYLQAIGQKDVMIEGSLRNE